VIDNFIETKGWKKIVEGLKQKVEIFIGTKNIFELFKLRKKCIFILEPCEKHIKKTSKL